MHYYLLRSFLIFCSILGNIWKLNFLVLLSCSKIKKHYIQHRVKICYLFILLISLLTNSPSNIKKIHLKTVTWHIINPIKKNIHTQRYIYTHLHICAAPNGANKSTQNYKKVIRNKEMTCLDVAFFLNMILTWLYMHI